MRYHSGSPLPKKLVSNGRVVLAHRDRRNWLQNEDKKKPAPKGWPVLLEGVTS